MHHRGQKPLPWRTGWKWVVAGGFDPQSCCRNSRARFRGTTVAKKICRRSSKLLPTNPHRLVLAEAESHASASTPTAQTPRSAERDSRQLGKHVFLRCTMRAECGRPFRNALYRRHPCAPNGQPCLLGLSFNRIGLTSPPFFGIATEPMASRRQTACSSARVLLINVLLDQCYFFKILGKCTSRYRPRPLPKANSFVPGIHGKPRRKNLLLFLRARPRIVPPETRAQTEIFRRSFQKRANFASSSGKLRGTKTPSTTRQCSVQLFPFNLQLILEWSRSSGTRSGWSRCANQTDPFRVQFRHLVPVR